MPPEAEWFANLTNPQMRRAYEAAVTDFVRFTGIARPGEFRAVTRAHVIAWRDALVRRGLGGSTVGTGCRRSRRCSSVSAIRTR